jgi:hypothetical protein
VFCVVRYTWDGHVAVRCSKQRPPKQGFGLGLGETCRDKLEWQTPPRKRGLMTPLTPDVGSTPTSSTSRRGAVRRGVVGGGAVQRGLLCSRRVSSAPVLYGTPRTCSAGNGAAGYATLRCGKDMAVGRRRVLLLLFPSWRVRLPPLPLLGVRLGWVVLSVLRLGSVG